MNSHNSLISEEKRVLQELQAHLNKDLQLYGEESDHYFSDFPEAIVNGYLVKKNRVHKLTLME
ncbi:unnamed protein product, partial [marine sediment metagenome]